MTLTDEQLRDGLALCEAATAGPWEQGMVSGQCHLTHSHSRDFCKYDYVLVADKHHVSIRPNVTLIGSDDNGPILSAPNAAFICSSRTLLPLALADIVTLRARLVTVEGARDEACDQWADCVDEFITNGADCEGDRKAIAQCRNAGKETSR